MLKKTFACFLSLLLILISLSSCTLLDGGDMEFYDSFGGIFSTVDSKAEESVSDASVNESESNISDQSFSEDVEESKAVIDENGVYTCAEDVALYIHTYRKLPNNFITKNEARALGWEGGGLEDYAPGKCIGGDRFGNYEELLPIKNGRFYTECDIDTLGKNSRGAKRIVFSNDGLVYYTDDHYESFALLYGEE